MGNTKIEWCNVTWSPITGCSPISKGCTNCYAKRMAQRLKGRFGYPEDEPFRVTFHPDRLDQPLRWKKPRHIFVCSMGDLFHNDIADHEINSVFLTILKADWHIYLILTKRAERMADFISIGTGWRGMMPHVWVGVTVESDKYLWRIDELFRTPAAKHFVSFEPLLGPIDLEKPHGQGIGELYIDYLDWVIAGCESGPNRRQAKTQWFRDLKNQCVDAGIPFFLKQANGYINGKSTIIKLPQLDGRQWDEKPVL